MDLKLTMKTDPALAGIARDLAARFAESSGFAGPDAAEVAEAVVSLVAQASSEHPLAGCEMTIALVGEAGSLEVTVSYPAGSCGPGAAAGAWNSERTPESVRRAFDRVDCRTEGGTRHCRLTRRAVAGS
ncbi:MAG: hypothetical protein ACE148_10940 [Vicinamibacterales bacterium]